MNEQYQNENFILWENLPLSVKNDITENLRNNIKYLQSNYWNMVGYMCCTPNHNLLKLSTTLHWRITYVPCYVPLEFTDKTTDNIDFLEVEKDRFCKKCNKLRTLASIITQLILKR